MGCLRYPSICSLNESAIGKFEEKRDRPKTAPIPALDEEARKPDQSRKAQNDLAAIFIAVGLTGLEVDANFHGNPPILAALGPYSSRLRARLDQLPGLPFGYSWLEVPGGSDYCDAAFLPLTRDMGGPSRTFKAISKQYGLRAYYAMQSALVSQVFWKSALGKPPRGMAEHVQ